MMNIKVTESFEYRPISVTGSTSTANLINNESNLHYIQNILSDYLELEDNWNGYNSSPIDLKTLTNVKSILLNSRITDVSPTGRKSILLEYTRHDADLLIEVFSDTYGYAIIPKEGLNSIEKSNIVFNLSSIVSIIKEFFGTLSVPLHTYYRTTISL